MARKSSGYEFYLKKCLLPVAPEKLQTKINGANKTLTLINDGEVNVLKTPGLTDIEFEALIPQVKYPFATYSSGFEDAEYFLDYFEKLMKKKKAFQFIVSRARPNGSSFFSTDLKVSMESYTVTESAGDGFDLSVKIKLKQYKSYSTKTVYIAPVEDQVQATETEVRSDESAPDTSANQTYTVVSGDCLWNIAKRFYGNGALYTTIYNANLDVVGSNPDLIYPGQVLVIPAI